MKKETTGNKLEVYFDHVFLVFTQACRCSNKIQLTWAEHSFSEALRTILVLNYLGFEIFLRCEIASDWD